MSTDSSKIIIKKATPLDIDKLVDIGRITFRETFLPFNNENVIKEYLDKNITHERFSSQLENPNSQFYIAYYEEKLVGYLKVNFKDAQTENLDQNSLKINKELAVPKVEKAGHRAASRCIFSLNPWSRRCSATQNKPFETPTDRTSHQGVVLEDHGNSMEIERIYVLKEFHGKKVAQKLMDLALEIANENNVSFIWLGVWDKNLRAVNFYKEYGFKEFDTHIFMMGPKEQVDLLLKLDIKS